MSVAIALSQLYFRYPQGEFCLNCPPLEFAAATTTLITGANGSGKTTLSKLMCGILKPLQGELRVFGEVAAHWSLGRMGQRIGYLFQNPARQLFTTSVGQELTFAAAYLNQAEATKAAARADELLHKFNLQALTQRSIYHLSQGEKQRLALCTMLMNGADYFILDEPSNGLDKRGRHALYSLIETLGKEGKGFAIISHDKELLGLYSQNHLRLERGRIL